MLDGFILILSHILITCYDDEDNDAVQINKQNSYLIILMIRYDDFECFLLFNFDSILTF